MLYVKTKYFLNYNNNNNLCLYTPVTVTVDNFFIINIDICDNLGENRSVRSYQRFSPKAVV